MADFMKNKSDNVHFSPKSIHLKRSISSSFCKRQHGSTNAKKQTEKGGAKAFHLYLLKFFKLKIKSPFNIFSISVERTGIRNER